MEYKNLLIEKEERIAVVKFNRPDALNAMNTETTLELEKAIHELNEDDEVKVVILTGEGKAFVAGADINEMSKMDSLQARAFGQMGQRVLAYIENMEKPVIAAVNGFALGGGCEISMACDIRLASEYASFGQPELKLGLIPGWAGTQRMSRLIGIGKAKELIFTGEVVKADEALRIGLVNKVVPADDLMKEAKALAKKMLQMGPVALKLAKTVINRGIDSNFTTASQYESEAFGVCFSVDEAKEGMSAFLEKRNPKW